MPTGSSLSLSSLGHFPRMRRSARHRSAHPSSRMPALAAATPRRALSPTPPISSSPTPFFSLFLSTFLFLHTGRGLPRSGGRRLVPRAALHQLPPPRACRRSCGLLRLPVEGASKGECVATHPGNAFAGEVPGGLARASRGGWGRGDGRGEAAAAAAAAAGTGGNGGTGGNYGGGGGGGGAGSGAGGVGGTGGPGVCWILEWT